MIRVSRAAFQDAGWLPYHYSSPQMIAGCSPSAANLANELPSTDSAAEFLTWVYAWIEDYLYHKGRTFRDLCAAKRLRLGVATLQDGTVA